MASIFHAATREDWERAPDAPYSPASLAREGFVHCSTRETLIESADLHFRGRTDLLVLGIDASALGDALRWELAPARGTLFPHVYRPIDRRAVVALAPLVPRADGTFVMPRALREAS